MKSIIIADKHAIIGYGIRALFDIRSDELNIVEVNSCSSLVTQINLLKPEFLITDTDFTDGSIFSVIEYIIAKNPGIQVLVYTENAESIYAERLFRIGVTGFLNKSKSLEDLQNAISKLLKSEMYVSDYLQKKFFLNGKKKEYVNPIKQLSVRELETMEYIAAGMGSKDIANKMNLDITTVSTYRRRGFVKMGVTNMIELKEKLKLYKENPSKL